MTSRSDFGQTTTGTEVANLFDSSIRGKTVIITGVSPKSLGETLALTIARHAPANLILASKTKWKLEEVQQAIAKESSIQPQLVILDLASQAAIREAALEISQLVPHIDIVINNAAVVPSDRRETVDGLELQFGANYLGHWLLVNLLMPKLLASKAPRVVNVSSGGYVLSPFRFHDYNFQGNPVPPEEQPPPGVIAPNAAEGRPYAVFTAYGQSKTAQILHAISLNEKFGAKGLRAFAIHPGTISTDLSRNLLPEHAAMIGSRPGSFWKSHDQGIATMLVAALDPALDKTDGKVYLSDCQIEKEVAKHANDPVVAEKLWELSESLVSEYAKL